MGCTKTNAIEVALELLRIIDNSCGRSKTTDQDWQQLAFIGNYWQA